MLQPLIFSCVLKLPWSVHQLKAKKATFWTVTTQPRLTNGLHKPACGVLGNIFWETAHWRCKVPFSLHLPSLSSPRAPSLLGSHGAPAMPLLFAAAAHGQLHNAGPGASPGNALNGHGSAATANIDKGQERVRRVISYNWTLILQWPIFYSLTGVAFATA